MNTDVATLALTLGTTVLGAFAGAFLSSRFGYQQSARSELDRRRRSAADTVIPPLLELRRLLRNAETSRAAHEWASVTELAYEALDDARYLLPQGLKHLKRSIRASIGEAVGGVAVADLDPRMLGYELAPYNYRWTSYASEYLDGALDQMREWRDAPRSSASAVSMRDYDDWLARSGRYGSGETTLY